LAESLGSDPERFSPGLSVMLRSNVESGPERPATLERCWTQNRLLVLKFSGIDTRSEAETLQGWLVCIPETERPPIEEGQHYLSDLVGCDVVAADGRLIGQVTGWQDIGGPVVLELGDDLLIPFVPQICVDVNVAERTIRVELPEGLEDLNRR